METEEDQQAQQSTGVRADRSKPIKPLPTDRLTLETQFSVLRGYAAASGTDRKAVSNDEVGKTVGMNPNSISICNPFWESIGLIVREGRRQRPADVVFDYFQAYQWNQDTAATKLAPALSQSWFCEVLIPKLRFRPLSKIEAAGFLADEAKASKNYRDNLYLLIEYLRQAGIVSIDGDMVSIAQLQQELPPPPPPPSGQVPPQNQNQQPPDTPQAGMKRFAIHVPDKNDAIISLPEDLDKEDWDMVLDVIQKYVNRWKKF